MAFFFLYFLTDDITKISKDKEPITKESKLIEEEAPWRRTVPIRTRPQPESPVKRKYLYVNLFKYDETN